MHGSLNQRDLLRAELSQRDESGFETSGVRVQIERLGGLNSLDPAGADGLLAELDDLPRSAEWPFVEPEGLDEIRAAGDWPEPVPFDLDDGYAEKINRAWTGRIAGNMLGKPVESGDEWTPKAIRTFLEANAAWPLVDYFPAMTDTGAEHPDYRENWVESTAGRVDGSSRDDDVDYTILNLHVLRRVGPAFSTGDVATAWLTMLPFLQTYTAERATIRNLIKGIAPGGAARHRNPYREWIGAAIRADIFGYCCPGDPGRAAELAYRDAVLSHTANGVYGEMWCAALIAASFTAPSAAAALQTSLQVVPTGSRLSKAIRDTIAWHAEGLTWQQTRDRIEEAFGHYGWVHTINNAAVLAAGLLYGDGSFDQSIGLTVCGGWDTDSNGGTAGSVAGILAQRIDDHWVAPLHDHVRSAVFGYDGTSIGWLADQTVQVARSLRAGSSEPIDPAPGIPLDSW
ncbi:ADP-ribosylglycohydrolase family protein [Microlunatus elymi]|uniref:ADP-ribosylglycohydrolase family protein n=1 Tax=Microlunatus elymi TaxID=2596828 RepID=A0A516PXW2_9ACTN|nr:ADP-ribosylglycohydrolase family protein [Microlunatus elymi]QDP96003.1 ADP-ribosylglycohydrolase family protein [Microlunatus elymi]